MNEQLDMITFHHKQTPLIIRFFLGLLVLVCALIPIVALSVVILNRKGLHIGVFFIFFLFWGLGFMMLRSYLWNSFGKETLYLQKNKIIYLADYKYFRDARQEIEIEGLEAEIVYSETINGSGTLRLTNEKTTIETVLETSTEILLNEIYKIETTYLPDS